MRGNRSASERGKLIESDFTRCAYTVTGVQTDSMAAVSFKGGQSSRGGLGVDEGACQTMQAKMSTLEPTVAIRTANGVECLCPDQPQSHRVFSPDGAMPCLNAMEKRGGCDSAAICVRTANTHANGQAVAFKLDSTLANSMKSANPHSGIHETEVHCALDTTDPNPTKAQGGVVLATPIAIGIGRDAFNSGKNAQMGMSISREVMPPQTAVGGGGSMHQWRTTNGEDVMPTLDTRLAAQVDKQMERNGSYLCGPLNC